MSVDSKTILVTVDLEDWFQVENLRSRLPIRMWDRCELRVRQSTKVLLRLFDRHGVKATFFVLGWLAERVPDLVLEISDAGHEIASHGSMHRLCQELSEKELHADVVKSKKILEELTGTRIRGYRAPSFSIDGRLGRILSAAGFTYDSSFNDFRMHGRYGKLDGSWTDYGRGVLKSETGLYEIPVRNLKIAGNTVPWAGGGYFRALPGWIFNQGVRRFLKDNDFFLFYCHPWEFDPGQPRVKALPLGRRLRHYLNIGKSFEKLDRFLGTFSYCRFPTCTDFLDETIHTGV